MILCSSIYSQDTSRITITSDQLRTANLIFAEHKEFSRLVPLIQQENANLQIINKTWERTDSIKTSQINQQYKMIEKQNENIDKLKKSIKVRNAVTGVSLITVVLCLLLN